jgi:hypothetical protein
MKPAHESAATVITTTQQRQLIERLMEKHLEEGGSVLAQVFFDGFRVRVLTPEQTRALQPAINRALGQSGVGGTIRHSAFDKSQHEGGAA